MMEEVSEKLCNASGLLEMELKRIGDVFESSVSTKLSGKSFVMDKAQLARLVEGSPMPLTKLAQHVWELTVSRQQQKHDSNKENKRPAGININVTCPTTTECSLATTSRDITPSIVRNRIVDLATRKAYKSGAPTTNNSSDADASSFMADDVMELDESNVWLRWELRCVKSLKTKEERERVQGMRNIFKKGAKLSVRMQRIVTKQQQQNTTSGGSPPPNNANSNNNSLSEAQELLVEYEALIESMTVGERDMAKKKKQSIASFFSKPKDLSTAAKPAREKKEEEEEENAIQRDANTNTAATTTTTNNTNTNNSNNSFTALFETPIKAATGGVSLSPSPASASIPQSCNSKRSCSEMLAGSTVGPSQSAEKKSLSSSRKKKPKSVEQLAREEEREKKRQERLRQQKEREEEKERKRKQRVLEQRLKQEEREMKKKQKLEEQKAREEERELQRQQKLKEQKQREEERELKKKQKLEEQRQREEERELKKKQKLEEERAKQEEKEAALRKRKLMFSRMGIQRVSNNDRTKSNAKDQSATEANRKKLDAAALDLDRALSQSETLATSQLFGSLLKRCKELRSNRRSAKSKSKAFGQPPPFSARRTNRSKKKGSLKETVNNNEVVEVIDDEEESEQQQLKAGGRCWRRKLLQFSENEKTQGGSGRPPYYGSFTPASKSVSGRTPFAKDALMDYEFDSADEWEEPEDGEDLFSDGEEEVEEEIEEDEDAEFIVSDEVVSFSEFTPQDLCELELAVMRANRSCKAVILKDGLEALTMVVNGNDQIQVPRKREEIEKEKERKRAEKAKVEKEKKASGEQTPKAKQQKTNKVEKKDTEPKKKRPLSGYQKFVSHIREETKTEVMAKLEAGAEVDKRAVNNDIFKAIAAKWKALPEEERTQWNKAAAEAAAKAKAEADAEKAEAEKKEEKKEEEQTNANADGTPPKAATPKAATPEKKKKSSPKKKPSPAKRRLSPKKIIPEKVSGSQKLDKFWKTLSSSQPSDSKNENAVIPIANVQIAGGGDKKDTTSSIVILDK